MNNRTKQALEHPSQQEPFAWADINALTAQFNSVNCGTAYRLPGEGRQPLYTHPPPCTTCEALARTVMLDQTSHDAQRKPLTITEESAWDLARYVYARSNPHESPQILLSAMEIKQIIEAAHGIKENT